MKSRENPIPYPNLLLFCTVDSFPLNDNPGKMSLFYISPFSLIKGTSSTVGPLGMKGYFGNLNHTILCGGYNIMCVCVCV